MILTLYQIKLSLVNKSNIKYWNDRNEVIFFDSYWIWGKN